MSRKEGLSEEPVGVGVETWVGVGPGMGAVECRSPWTTSAKLLGRVRDGGQRTDAPDQDGGLGHRTRGGRGE